jgi:hypothetical protein
LKEGDGCQSSKCSEKFVTNVNNKNCLSHNTIYTLKYIFAISTPSTLNTIWSVLTPWICQHNTLQASLHCSGVLSHTIGVSPNHSFSDQSFKKEKKDHYKNLCMHLSLLYVNIKIGRLIILDGYSYVRIIF